MNWLFNGFADIWIPIARIRQTLREHHCRHQYNAPHLPSPVAEEYHSSVTRTIPKAYLTHPGLGPPRTVTNRRAVAVSFWGVFDEAVAWNSNHEFAIAYARGCETGGHGSDLTCTNL